MKFTFVLLALVLAQRYKVEDDFSLDDLDEFALSELSDLFDEEPVGMDLDSFLREVEHADDESDSSSSSDELDLGRPFVPAHGVNHPVGSTWQGFDVEDHLFDPRYPEETTGDEDPLHSFFDHVEQKYGSITLADVKRHEDDEFPLGLEELLTPNMIHELEVGTMESYLAQQKDEQAKKDEKEENEDPEEDKKEEDRQSMKDKDGKEEEENEADNRLQAKLENKEKKITKKLDKVDKKIQKKLEEEQKDLKKDEEEEEKEHNGEIEKKGKSEKKSEAENKSEDEEKSEDEKENESEDKKEKESEDEKEKESEDENESEGKEKVKKDDDLKTKTKQLSKKIDDLSKMVDKSAAAKQMEKDQQSLVEAAKEVDGDDGNVLSADKMLMLNFLQRILSTCPYEVRVEFVRRFKSRYGNSKKRDIILETVNKFRDTMEAYVKGETNLSEETQEEIDEAKNVAIAMAEKREEKAGTKINPDPEKEILKKLNLDLD